MGIASALLVLRACARGWIDARDVLSGGFFSVIARVCVCEYFTGTAGEGRGRRRRLGGRRYSRSEVNRVRTLLTCKTVRAVGAGERERKMCYVVGGAVNGSEKDSR